MISNIKRYDELLCPPHALYLQTHHSSEVSFAVINLSIVGKCPKPGPLCICCLISRQFAKLPFREKKLFL